MPALCAGRDYSHSVFYYSAPRITGTIFNLASFSLLTSIILSLCLLPKAKGKSSIFRRIGFAFQWLLVPFTIIFLTSLPALDAQTRLMMKKYMTFWVTDKGKMKKMKKIIASFLVAFLLATTCSYAEEVRLGTTFSQVQSEYLDLDPAETYLKVLDMGFDIVRLGAYWNEIEQTEGEFDFSTLDWQIAEAEKRGVPIILTVGMKAPRWPEYFIPAWLLEKIDLPAGSEVSKNKLLRQKTKTFILKVVERYRSKDIIKVWQVENEALNKFGGESWYIGKDFLLQEVKFVRWLDGGQRQILLTTATYPNFFQSIFVRIVVKQDSMQESLELCDILGLNIYPIIGHKAWWFKFYWRIAKRGLNKYLTRTYDRIKDAGKEAWIVELQAEPWEPGVVAHKKKKSTQSAHPVATETNVKDCVQTGYKTILLWGAEYWIYRALKHKDTRWLEMWDRLKEDNR